MGGGSSRSNKLLDKLKDQEKTINCLFEIEELIKSADDEDILFQDVIRAIPKGWQYPDKCLVKIVYEDDVFYSDNFRETPWEIRAGISVQIETVGMIHVYYTEQLPVADEGPFLNRERKLLNTIADRLGHFILHLSMGHIMKKKQEPVPQKKAEWWIILELLERTDPKLLLRICRKMTNFLCWSGIKDAERLLEYFAPTYESTDDSQEEDMNRPKQKRAMQSIMSITEEIFKFASTHLSEQDILNNIQRWMKEDRSNFLANILENPGSSLAEITDAIERYHNLSPDQGELSQPREKGFRVSLIRRLLTDQADFIDIAKRYVSVNDFNDLLRRVIFPVGSQGKLGGKSAGLFLATRVLKQAAEKNDLLQNVKMPKTWYLTSDGILYFMKYNNLEDVMEQKYKEIWQIRQEFPYVEQVFKNSPFAPEIIKGLSMALDDFGDRPLIVRSSSLLEDRFGTAFAGKYKSLFIANQGPKEKRLAELTDAIAEVYASIFGPDPIEYRMERGLQDFHEEMGIMIQEVVGQKIGDYYLPAFAGVAFSRNEFRWSGRIKVSDGLLRLVPGLGTRAVDRVSDDYPIMLAPGQPGLRVNITVDENVRYSPSKIDVINLRNNTFETVEIEDLLKHHGHEYEGINSIVSVLKGGLLRLPGGLGPDFDNDKLIVTFEGLNTRTDFLKQIHAILTELEEKLETPVDIEFAHDGKQFYLLQCRPQSYNLDNKPAEIPVDIPDDRLLFSANRYISNGTVSNISHIVYVDPQSYSEIATREDLLSVGRAVSKLNQVLPKRKFILMGPGRWGSRGDIKLGVNVTYSDINNTAMLIEIARQKGNYTPDVSFGTHFFLDLVESQIRYLPLYPDDEKVDFNEPFFSNSPNLLGELLPAYAHLSDTIRVIDVKKISGDLNLQILMNGDLDRAVGMLGAPIQVVETTPTAVKKSIEKQPPPADDWRWRLQISEKIAAHLDPEVFGVEAFYIYGSTKNATATAESDINILIHFKGSPIQKSALIHWLDGWSLALDEINYSRTGHRHDGLLDYRLVTDADIERGTNYADKINAVTDRARELPVGTFKANQEKIAAAPDPLSGLGK